MRTLLGCCAVEALLLYLYSYLFLLEGTPAWHGDDRLQAAAWVLLGLVVAVPIFCLVVKIRNADP